MATGLLKYSERIICEEWKPIKGYENEYLISNYGNVKSIDRNTIQKGKVGIAKHIYKGKTIKKQLQRNGYYTVDLHKNGKIKRCFVHRLVGLHFVENANNKPFINHLDANKTNNLYTNLEWCTQSENIQYAYDNKTKVAPHQKKVAQYDLNGNLLKEWNSISEAQRTTKVLNIYKCCVGKRKTAGGYIWKYIQ